MNWVDIVWLMSGAASLTLGCIHLSIWLRRRRHWTHLAFSVAAFGVAAMAMVELASLRVSDPVQYAAILRWGHVPFAVTILSLVAYVHLRFQESRTALAFLAVGARLAALTANFLSGENLNFRSIESLDRVTFLGGELSAPVGIINPWMALGQLSQLLLMVYLVDVIIRTWRRRGHEERKRALIVCGSILLFLVSNNTWTILVVLGVVNFPIVVNVTFVAVIVVMGYELGGEVLRAAFLSESLVGSQDRLRESERRLRLAAQAGGLGLWIWRTSIGSTWLTDNGRALLGLAPGQDLRWAALLDRVHPADVPDMVSSREAALSGATYACEFRILQDDGSVRWLAASGRGDAEDADEPGIIRGVLQDVTERRVAEERFRLMVENAPYAILMVEYDGRIALANARAERLFGYDRIELASLTVDALILLELDGAGFVTSPASADDARDTTSGLTSTARRKDGQDVPVEVVLTPLQIGGNPYTIASITDISEQLKLEQQASIQRDELAHLSRVALLGELSGSLAHELNQPLTAVLSNAQAALRFMDHQPPNLAEVRESLHCIVESDKRASEVIRRLRAMMRKDAVKHEEMDVNEIVRESLQLVNTDLISRGVAHSLEASPDLPTIIGDAVQVKQVLLNLIINACDAMRDRPSERLLSLRTLAHPDGMVEIRVSDTGGGIPEADLERIFSPFVTTKSEGIGLGLAICRTIIHAHGGHLSADNNESGGATFRFLLAREGRPA